MSLKGTINLAQGNKSEQEKRKPLAEVKLLETMRRTKLDTN